MIKKVLLWIWQLPQNLVAVIILLIHHKEVQKVESFQYPVWVIPSWDSWGAGVSLGDYILLAPKHVSLTTVKHEHGHQIQSTYLGPLYLIVVGFTSAICNNLWDRLFHKQWKVKDRIKWYYSRFPEKWADELGGVPPRW